jgi:MiaB-like tRNA modifying enzyme
MKIQITTYGCSANINNSEIIEAILIKGKHKIVDSEEKADLVVLNTCIVKGPTEHRIIKKMQEIKKPIVVAGCMAEAQQELVKKIRGDAILVGLNSLKNISRAIKQKKDFLGKGREIKLRLPKKNRNKAVEIIQIAEGCLGNCSYCITKLAKGKLFSYPEELIVDAVRKSRAKEIWLTSQDCGAYGMDTGTNLPNLLKKILKLRKDFLLRIGMMNPNHVLNFVDELVEVYKDKRIFKFIHIPVQSGNDDILLKMNRDYKAGDFVSIVEKFRENFPRITLATDIICGFPGETAEQFDGSVKLIEKIKPDVLNISKFWPRPKTLAANMRQIDVETRNERSRKIKELSMQITTEKNKSWLSWEGDVYADEIRESGDIAGRNFAYRQIVLPNAKKTMIGKTLKTKVVETGINYLKGV